jgi:hypothetical protein
LWSSTSLPFFFSCSISKQEHIFFSSFHSVNHLIALLAIDTIAGCCGSICSCIGRSKIIIILTNLDTIECQRHHYSVVITSSSLNFHQQLIVKSFFLFFFLNIDLTIIFRDFSFHYFLSVKSIFIITRRALCTSIDR